MRPRETADLIKQGVSPSAIAKRFAVSFGSVRQYLFIAVGEGLIRRSDILFGIAQDLRTHIEEVITKTGVEPFKIASELKCRRVSFDPGEVQLYLALRGDRVSAGDLYEFVSQIERTLHDAIRQVLQEAFGPDEAGWWRQGVPQAVRIDCVSAQERDEEFTAEPYEYTTLIHLKDIMDRSWKLFSNRLPPDVAADKPQLLRSLTRLNSIRNRVMHPVRATPPTEDDFAFVRQLHSRLHHDRWRDNNEA